MENIEDLLLSLDSVPLELQQVMDELRAKEAQVSETVGRILQKQKRLRKSLGGVNAPASQQARLQEDIRQKYVTLKALSSAKCQTAMAAIDLIDRHIARVDSLLYRNREDWCGVVVEARANGDRAVSGLFDDIDLEPKITCFCKQGDYGQMIACDDPNCKFEWFHMECVGMKKIPPEKWFCPYCRV